MNDEIQNRSVATIIDSLPPANTKRWVPNRKANVVNAIRNGAMSRIEACSRYSLSDEELRLWERALDTVGIPGLRVTRVQIYRDTFKDVMN